MTIIEIVLNNICSDRFRYEEEWIKKITDEELIVEAIKLNGKVLNELVSRGIITNESMDILL